MDFRTWLTEQYYEQAHQYRVALEREVRYAIVIYGHPIPKDVRPKLIASLKEIEIPTLQKWPYGETGENFMSIFKSITPPNFHIIRMEVMESV